jgi:ABC-type sulfate/molybdate transport systems ATPase subunit
MSASEPIVRFVGIGKTYDGVNRVVDDLHLDIERGEFLTLLGPSGSGKTTTLMMLAGFEAPTSARSCSTASRCRACPPYQRHIGMVFQNYALFPHMSVAENIGFPLSVRGNRARRDRPQSRARAGNGQLGGFGARRPSQLSGGQQQRVAVARALVFEPKLVLMDEPLGALDKQLREQMQLEIRRLHAALGVTMVYVTHDQAEALHDVDRIAVFHRGRIQQLDRPERLYERPSTRSSPASSARTTASRVRCSGGRRPLLDPDRRRRVDRRLAGVAAARRHGGDGFAATRASANRCARAYNRRDRRVLPRGNVARGDLSGRSRPGARGAAGQRRFHGEATDRRGEPVAGDRRRGRARLGARALQGIRTGRHGGLTLEEEMMRNLMLKLGVLAALTAVMAGAAARDLTVVSWGGAYQDAQREAYFKPFMATGTKMAEESWDGGVGTLRAKIQGGNNNWDVVQVESEELLLGCEEGPVREARLVEARRQGQVPAGRGQRLRRRRHRLQLHPRLRRRQDQRATRRNRGRTSGTCRSGRASARCARAEDDARDRADGRRRRARGRLQDARHAAGVDRAFKKLDQLKANLVWWEKGSQPPQLLASGEVAMTDAYNGRIAAANDKDKKNFKIVWTNNLYTIDSWVIMKGSPKKADAEKYLVFVNDPQNQKNLPPRSRTA